MYGNLPSATQLADWEFAISQHSALPDGLMVYAHFSLVYISTKAIFLPLYLDMLFNSFYVKKILVVKFILPACVLLNVFCNVSIKQLF